MGVANGVPPPSASNVALRARLPRLHAFDLAVFRRATANPAPMLDRVLYPLSRAADHSKLWIGVSALLAARGGRANRRAALRGLLSVAATSAVTNAFIKPLAARPRPESVSSEWLTRVARVPASTSFPSGHSASAAAFATAVGMEVPQLRAPLGLAAGAVGWSRVRTRVHYPGDVVVGFAAGVAVAYATKRVWRLRPTTPVAMHPVRARAARADTDGEGLTVVVNPAARTASGDDLVTKIRDELPRCRVLVRGESDDLLQLLRTAAEDEVVGVVGGDGSINAAASVAMDGAKPLAVFPGGTLNHFARDLGLDSIDHTIDAIRTKSVGAVDVGLIEDRPFLNTASFGSYAELVDAREELEGELGKWPAMAIALVKVLRHATPVDVTMNGVHRSIWLIFIGNGTYGPPGLAPSWREHLDDGLFDVRYVEDTGPYSRLRLVAAVLTGQLPRSKVYARELLSSIDIESHDGPMRLACDGETYDGPAMVRVRKHESPLTVYVQPR